MLRFFTLSLMGLVSTAAVVSAGDHCFVNGGGAPIIVGNGYGGGASPIIVGNGYGYGGGAPIIVADSRQFFSQPRPIVVDRRPIIVNNGGGGRRQFLGGGGGRGNGGPVANLIRTVGQVANSPAGTFVLGALAGGGAFR